jgi:hypothetical protein
MLHPVQQEQAAGLTLVLIGLIVSMYKLMVSMLVSLHSQ